MMNAGNDDERLDEEQQRQQNEDDDDQQQQQQQESSLDELEERLIGVLDAFKSASAGADRKEELMGLVTQCVELCAHGLVSSARKMSIERGRGSLPALLKEHHSALLSTLAYPSFLEIAQSDTSPARRTAALQFFADLYREASSNSSFLSSDSANDISVKAGWISEESFSSDRRGYETALLVTWIQVC
jgi:hypothetical protein